MSLGLFGRAAGMQAPRLLGAWFDSERSGWAVWILLALFVVVWTAFHIISNAALDLHDDITEIYTWSRTLRPGYYKHPPLGALMAAPWFVLFPAADWSFRLFAMLNAALALFAVDLIARRYLSGDKRLLALLLLLLMPFYQFFSERFASNQTLLATWPLATYCFLRAFETRGFCWSAAAGVAAAAAMLGKYYSIYLIGSFVVAALAHPARWTYLRSPSPWISAVVGLLVLSPHVHWLMTTGFQPFAYAIDVHGRDSAAVLAWRAITYVAGAFAYVAVPFAVYLVVARPSRATLLEVLWPADARRRMLVVLLAGQVLLPPLTAPFFGMRLTSLWSMQAWFLLPIVLLSASGVTVPRRRAEWVAVGVAAVAAAALLASPALAWFYHLSGLRMDRAYFSAVSDELTRQWRRATDRPLRIVLGTTDLAASATFYMPDHPHSAPINWVWAFPWITEQRLRGEGWAAVCPATDRLCPEIARLRAAAHNGVRMNEVELAPRFFGHAGAPRRFLFVIVPPAQARQP